jgi:hypothetical protein
VVKNAVLAVELLEVPRVTLCALSILGCGAGCGATVTRVDEEVLVLVFRVLLTVALEILFKLGAKLPVGSPIPLAVVAPGSVTEAVSTPVMNALSESAMNTLSGSLDKVLSRLLAIVISELVAVGSPPMTKRHLPSIYRTSSQSGVS